MKKFDLTTSEGLKKAMDNPFLPIFFPQIWLVKKTFALFSNTDTISEQRKTAIELIKSGKEKGVDELEIVLSQKAGLNIESDFEGIPIKAQIGKNGDMTLKVKYK